MKKVTFLVIVLLLTIKTFAKAEPAVLTNHKKVHPATTSSGIEPSLIETPVSLKTLSGTISGSLVMPKSVTGKIPVVLIIGDSGPTDRNGNNPKAGINANTYKLLANALGQNGIASLRYDKRLVGQSVSTTKESQLRIDDYSDDAVGLINMLNDDQRFSKIILFGHGEGSLVGMIAIVDEPVKAFISAEGAGDQADKLLLEQMKEKPKFVADEFKTILDSLRKGKTTDNVDPSLYYIARPSLQNFLMSWCRCVPIKGIKRIKDPVLIIQGSTDLQITVQNAEKLKKAKSDASLLVIKDMNHILKEAPADPEKNAATFDKPDLPLKPELITGVVDFINKLK
jgi:pimeloyl-ACP methyl ester carboxylesterase